MGAWEKRRCLRGAGAGRAFSLICGRAGSPHNRPSPLHPLARSLPRRMHLERDARQLQQLQAARVGPRKQLHGLWLRFVHDRVHARWVGSAGPFSSIFGHNITTPPYHHPSPAFISPSLPCTRPSREDGRPVDHVQEGQVMSSRHRPSWTVKFICHHNHLITAAACFPAALPTSSD
jgi:hypothetical protein